jgi:hypothetical protein
MKRHVIGVLASVMAASALIAAQAQSSTQPQSMQDQKTGADVTVTGCLIQGSSPAVFILDNARQKAGDMTEKAQSYVVIASSEDLPLTANLNHEVSVTGSADAKVTTVPPAGEKVAEKDMPRFSAKNLTMVADRCTAPAR